MEQDDEMITKPNKFDEGSLKQIIGSPTRHDSDSPEEYSAEQIKAMKARRQRMKARGGAYVPGDDHAVFMADGTTKKRSIDSNRFANIIDEPAIDRNYSNKRNERPKEENKFKSPGWNVFSDFKNVPSPFEIRWNIFNYLKYSSTEGQDRQISLHS
eukprot:UN31441